MAATKESADIGVNQVNEDFNSYRTAKVGVKVCPSNVKIKVDVSRIGSVRKTIIPARKMFVLCDKGAHMTTTSDTKVGLQCAKNIKGKSAYSGNQGFNVRRKALADISNAQSSSSRNATCDGSKPLKMSILRDKGAHVTTASDAKVGLQCAKNIKGNQGFNVRRKTLVDISNAQSSSSRKATCDGSKPFISAGPGSRAVNASSRKSSKNNDKDSEKVTRQSLFSGKAKLNKNVEQVSISRGYLRKRTSVGGVAMKARISLPPMRSEMRTFKDSQQVSISRGYLRRKTSVGAVAIAPKDQTIMHVHGSSRNFKPTGKTTNVKFNSQRNLRSKSTAVNKKSTSIFDKSNKSDKSVKSSSLDHISEVVPNEATKQPSFDSSSTSTTNKMATIVRRKSDRRSYTSSLMAKSKLLLEHGEVEQDKVPCIDDNCNQLEVAEYVDDIYQFYWTSERHNISLANYMSVPTEITPQMRGILINWLIEVHLKFELMQETLYLMVMLLDQYLSQVEIEKRELQLVGLTALLLASKYEDFWHPRVKDLLSISAESYTRDQMLAMEKLFLKKLKFRLNVPTLYVFMLRFLKAAQADLKLEHLAFYLIELSLVEYEALKFKPSMLCASAIYVARSTLQISPSWSPLLAKHARYDFSQIRDCAEMILRIQNAANKSRLKVTYDKYMSCDLSRVAAIKPLSKLPL